MGEGRGTEDTDLKELGVGERPCGTPFCKAVAVGSEARVPEGAWRRGKERVPRAPLAPGARRSVLPPAWQVAVGFPHVLTRETPGP